jgi:hypothetical protein
LQQAQVTDESTSAEWRVPGREKCTGAVKIETVEKQRRAQVQVQDKIEMWQQQQQE